MKNRKKVLVESSTLEVPELFYPDYVGVVLAETAERYLLRHHLFFKSWVPKNSYLMRCRTIEQLTKGDKMLFKCPQCGNIVERDMRKKINKILLTHSGNYRNIYGNGLGNIRVVCKKLGGRT